jgi:uncharacterized protein (TIGR02996 family)
MISLTEDQRQAIVHAWEQQDAAGLAEACPPLGVALSLDGLQQLQHLGPFLKRRDVVVTLEEALGASHGLALRIFCLLLGPDLNGRLMCLAVRDEERLTVEIGYASNLDMTPSHVWSELRPWYRDLGRNQARARAWAKVPAPGRASFPLTALTPPASRGPEDASLLAAIVAAPEDDEIRLVYADYLTERGDPRGELIVRMLEQPRDPARIDVLLRDLGRRVAGEVAERARRWRIVRGFVEEVTMNAASFAKHGARLLQAHPIRRLSLEPLTSSTLATLAQSPALSGLRELALPRQTQLAPPIDLRPLGASPWLQSLRGLAFDHVEADPDEWEEVMAKVAAPRLEAVALWDIASTRGLMGLARNPSLSSLRRLDFRASRRLRVGPEGDLPELAMDALARSEGLRGLRELGLRECSWLNERAWSSLIGGRWCLEGLTLGGATLPDATAVRLASSPSAASLRRLSLPQCRALGEEGLMALLSMPRLERLDCHPSDLPPDAGERLARWIARLQQQRPELQVSIAGGPVTDPIKDLITDPITGR